MQSIILHITNHHHLYNLNLTFLMTLVMVMVKVMVKKVPYNFQLDSLFEIT